MNSRLYSLQVYRGIAAVMVVLFHVTIYARECFNVDFLGKCFSFGYVGVDFFFVLSGFIIYLVNRKAIGTPKTFPPYMLKRILRVYPIYWLIMTAKIAVLVLMPSVAKPYETDSMVILKSFLLFPQQSDLPIIGAAWTLSYEILFYLLFGLAIAVGLKGFRRLFVIWATSILGFQLIRALVGSSFQSHYLLDFILNERNLEFMLGVLSAYLVLNRTIVHSIWIVALGVVLFAVSAFYVINGGSVPSYTLFFGFASFLIVTGSAALESRRKSILPRPLVFLGDASYSVYLTHALFVNVFVLVLNRLDLVTRFGPTIPLLLMVIFAVCGGCLVYRIVEKPMLNTMNNWVNSHSPHVEPVAVASYHN